MDHQDSSTSRTNVVPALRVAQAPDKVICVAAQASLAAATTQAAATVMEFQADGEICTLMGSIDGDGVGAGMSAIKVKITINDSNEEVITNGQTGDYVPLAQLFGPTGHREFPIYRRVRAGTKWNFQFKNVSTGTAYIPAMSVAMITDLASRSRSQGG